MENETIKRKIDNLYPGVYDIPQEDVDEYVKYCDQAPVHAKSYNDFKTFNEMKEKCRKKGIESIMFRDDVVNVTKSVMFLGDRNSFDIIVVNTKYGVFRYSKDRQIY